MGYPARVEGEKKIFAIFYITWSFLQFRQLPDYIAKKFPAFHATLILIVEFIEAPLQVM
jgi:hypothetical protein